MKNIPLLFCVSLSFLVSCGGEVTNGTGVSDGVKNSDFRIFVSSEKYSGDLGGRNGADDKCNQLAKAAGLEREYIALISDASSDVKGRITLTAGAVHVFRGASDSLLVADSFDELWDGKDLKSKISYNEKFELLTAANGGKQEYPWTGSDSDGAKTTDNCQGWTSANSSFNGWIGHTDSLGSDWVESSASACHNTRNIYCISREI